MFVNCDALTTHCQPISRSFMCVNCDVLPHTVDLFPGLVHMCVICDALPHTVDLFLDLVCMCVNCDVLITHCQPASRSCM